MSSLLSYTSGLFSFAKSHLPSLSSVTSYLPNFSRSRQSTQQSTQTHDRIPTIEELQGKVAKLSTKIQDCSKQIQGCSKQIERCSKQIELQNQNITTANSLIKYYQPGQGVSSYTQFKCFIRRCLTRNVDQILVNQQKTIATSHEKITIYQTDSQVIERKKISMQKRMDSLNKRLALLYPQAQPLPAAQSSTEPQALTSLETQPLSAQQKVRGFLEQAPIFKKAEGQELLNGLMHQFSVPDGVQAMVNDDTMTITLSKAKTGKFNPDAPLLENSRAALKQSELEKNRLEGLTSNESTMNDRTNASNITRFGSFGTRVTIGIKSATINLDQTITLNRVNNSITFTGISMGRLPKTITLDTRDVGIVITVKSWAFTEFYFPKDIQLLFSQFIEFT